ncbi:hypothetical protein Ancab_031055 [Ancistrocladus abbreviatus]
MNFTVHVFEKSSGENIFSRGLDRLRVEGPNSLEGDRSKSGATSCHCSVTQCSRFVEANNERQASLVNSTSGSKRGNSNVSKFNDDNSSWKSSLGQTHRIAFTWREKEFSRSLETTTDGYVSPLDKSMEGALMVEGTSLVVRREKMANFIIYSADLGSEPQQEKCTNRILGEALGPTFVSNRCRELLDSGTGSRPNFVVLRLKRFAGFRPKNTKTKHSKAMIVKTTASRNMHSQSLFMGEHQAIVKPREVRTESQGNNADLVNTGDSLHDSNIQNMNRIFLNNLNHVMAEEIWDMRTCLGVHSAEDHQTLIQRIAKLQDS